VRERIVQLALDEPELSPRELAVQFTDTESYFVSEASVYRLLKAHDLITSPAFIVIKAADEFRDKTTASVGRDRNPPCSRGSASCRFHRRAAAVSCRSFGAVSAPFRPGR